MLALPNVYYVFTIVRKMDFSCSESYIGIHAKWTKFEFTLQLNIQSFCFPSSFYLE